MRSFGSIGSRLPTDPHYDFVFGALTLLLVDEIMKGWREDPVFSPYYHEVGRVRII